jgi:xylose isomerase
VDLEDIFIGHIGGMDTFARGLEVAQRIREQSGLPQFKQQRYSSFDKGDGARFEQGKLDLTALRDLARHSGEPEHRSGKQEWCENIINQYL